MGGDRISGSASWDLPDTKNPRASSPSRSPSLLRAVDLAALQQIVEPAHAVPAIAEGLEQHVVAPALARAAVLVREQVHQLLAFLRLQPRAEADLARLGVQVVQEEHRVVAPVVAHAEDRGRAGVEDLEIA